MVISDTKAGGTLPIPHIFIHFLALGRNFRESLPKTMVFQPTKVTYHGRLHDIHETEDMFYRVNPEIVQVLTDGELLLLKFTTEMRGAPPGAGVFFSGAGGEEPSHEKWWISPVKI